MAHNFDNVNVVTVGGATKKSEYDQVFDNATWLKDLVLGDDAEGSGVAGHAHTGIGSNDGEQIAQGGLKTALEEVSVTNSAGGTNVTLSNAGEHGFYPRIKSDNAGRNVTVQIASGYTSTEAYATIIDMMVVTDTCFAQFRYIQASRDEPVLWLLREKATGLQLASSYQPECIGDSHPFNDWNGAPLNDTHEILCLQLSDDIRLRRHLEHGFKEHGYLWQLHLGLYTGKIKLKEHGIPRLSKTEAPSLYHDKVKIKAWELEV